MMKRALLLAAMTIGMAASSFAGGAVYVRFGPPPPPRVAYIRAPGPGYVWTDGYYRYHGGRYVWVGGRWVYPPRPRAVWVPGYWQPGPRGHVWVGGFWR